MIWVRKYLLDGTVSQVFAKCAMLLRSFQRERFVNGEQHFGTTRHNVRMCCWEYYNPKTNVIIVPVIQADAQIAEFR